MDRLSIFYLCIGITFLHNIALSSSTNETNRNERKISHQKPHIIIIAADDMGINDISIRGSNQIPTPNIDAIGLMGIQLNRMYVAPMCTPSRASLLTGKYESNLGMQHFVIPSDSPYGLGLDEKLLPEYMQDAGYSTHIVGKWHLGFFKRDYTPLFRGFDSHFGYLGPYIDYYNHSLQRIGVPYDLAIGYDMRQNLSVHWETNGQYATDLFSDKAVETIKNHDKGNPMFLYLAHLAPHTANEFDPLQAPESEIKKFDYIKCPQRRTYAAMVSKLDQGIGRVVKALDENDMLENSIILFLSDNGAPVIGQHANSGSNYPLRGQKDGPWEGAVRTAASIWSPLLRQRQRVSNQLIHISDWLPTFAKIAGVPLQSKVDGKNVWAALSHDLPSPRRKVLCHYDQDVPYKAFISGDYKYVSGSTYDGLYDSWISSYNDTEENLSFKENYAQEIRNSDAGRVLSKFILVESLQTTNKVDASPSISDAEINELRRKCKITCKGHVPSPSTNSTSNCNPIKSPCLFNIVNDPCETTNIASQYPMLLKQLEQQVAYYGSIAKTPRNKPGDPNCNPAHFNGTWTWWYDELGISNKTGSTGRLLNHEQIIAFTFCTVLVLFKFLLLKD